MWLGHPASVLDIGSGKASDFRNEAGNIRDGVVQVQGLGDLSSQSLAQVTSELLLSAQSQLAQLFPTGTSKKSPQQRLGKNIQNDNAVWRQGHDRLGSGLGCARPCCVNCGHGTVSPCLGFHIEQKMPVTPGAAERVTIRTHTALMATPGTGGCDAGAEGCFWSPGASWPLSGICLNGSHGAALDSVNWPLV